MAILVRDPEIDREVRLLAKRWNCTLQEAIGRAVRQQAETPEERRKRLRRLTKELQERVRSRLKGDDGLTHKEFFDREYGDA
jgi:hypothetical protein